MKSVALFEKISKISLYALAFLLPLWFLPFTRDILNFQKQNLLILCVFLGVIAWLAKTVSKGELQIRVSWLYVPVALLVVVEALSTVFSIWRYGSFWGLPFNGADNFLVMSAFALLYFLVVNAIEEKELFQLFFFVIVSGSVAGVFSIFQLFHAFFLPFSFAKDVAFNTIGSFNSIGVIASILLPLALVFAFASKILLRWILWAFAVLLLLVVLCANFFNAWIILIAELLILLAFGMWNMKKRAEFGWVSFPMALLIVALFFLLFKVSIPGVPIAPLEVSPSRSFEWSMISRVLRANFVFGSGPGTFVFDYAKDKPAALNQTIFWSTRFSSGSSEFLDRVVTQGIAGGVALFTIALAALFFGVKTLARGKNDSFSWMIGLGTLASFAGIVVASVLYPFNLTTWFLFWILLGGLGVFIGGAHKKISIAPPSFLAVASSFMFLLILIFGVGLFFIEGQKYAAEFQYTKGAKMVSQGDAKNGIAKIATATTLNPWVDLYWRDLSQLYLGQANQISADKSLSAADQKTQVQTAIQNAVATANQAVFIAPVNVENLNVQGFVYRNLIGATGATEAAVASYEKATQLEPSSPFSWTELGRVYFLQAQNLASQKNMDDKKSEALLKALENLNKAVGLKADYAPAHYLIATVYDMQGKSDEAISKLEETQKIAPQDVGLAFQLGVMYYQKGDVADIAKAQAEFETAKSLNANYANARYMLGLVYDKQKQKDKAIAEFAKVAELNPDNAQIKQILSNINAGKPALTGVEQSQPPIQENPPEIQGASKKTK